MAMELPFNADAEKQVLTNMLFSKSILADTFTRLEENDFYVEANKIIYSTLRKINDKAGIAIDAYSLIDQLSIDGNLEKVGDAPYVMELAESYNDASNASYYIESVKEKSMLRKIILNAKDVIDNWKTDSAGDIGSYINSVSKKIEAITKDRRVENMMPIDEAFKKYEERVKGIKRGDADFKGLMTGYNSFDKLSLGFHSGEMTILAARPSVGKSALALNFLYRAALRTDKPCVFFSIEMDANQVTNRILSAKSGVPLRKIQEASFDNKEEIALNQSIKAISESNLYIDCTTTLKLVDIRSKLNKLASMYNGQIGLIAIDYIGLITPDVKSKKDQNRSLELGQISMGLKQIARDFDCPVLALSQLNREGDNTGKDGKAKKPGLANLRESGSLEQDADVVMFIHREDYQQTEVANATEGGDDPNKESDSAVSVIVAKNRNGRLFTLDFMFQKHIGRFVEMDKNR